MLSELLLRVHRCLVVMGLLLLIGRMGHKNRRLVDLSLCHRRRNQMLLMLLWLLLFLLLLWLLMLLLNLLLLKHSRCR